MNSEFWLKDKKTTRKRQGFRGRPFIGDRRLYKRLVALPEDSPQVVNFSRGGAHITARRCYRGQMGHWDDVTYVVGIEPSGGVVLTGYLSKNPTSHCQRTPFERRLGPGWTEKAFVQATRTMFFRLISEVRRIDWVDMVEEACKELPHAMVLEVRDEEKRLGKTSDYTEMEISEAQYWLKRLASRNYRSERFERQAASADQYGYASEDSAYTNYPRATLRPKEGTP